MPRKPVGTQVRSTPDWFDGNTAMAGGLAVAAAADSVQMSLFNDAPAGQYLYLYWMSLWNDATGGFRFSTFEGAQGTLLQQGQYIMAGRGAAFGAVYWDDLGGSPLVFPPNSTSYPGLGYMWDDDGIAYFVSPIGPISILPPGYSFAVNCEWTGPGPDGGAISATFYYTILPYIPNQ